MKHALRTVAIDLAKQVLHLVGADARGKDALAQAADTPGCDALYRPAASGANRISKPVAGRMTGPATAAGSGARAALARRVRQDRALSPV